MKYLVFIFLAFHVNVSAQMSKSMSEHKDSGIHFVEGLSWKEILEKAKAENKPIFLDCYTTWCAPCKAMDKNIYPLEEVGNFFNEHFLSVKVQMDKTKADKETVKNFYDDAAALEKKFIVDAYPTFIFLSPDGKPLHRASGGYNAEKFLKLAANALNPETQSYTLAEKYVPEKMDTSELKKVAVELKRAAPELAAKMLLVYFEKLDSKEKLTSENLELLSYFSSDPNVQAYTKNLINQVPQNDLFEKKYISVIMSFMTSTKDDKFRFVYNNSARIDEVMNQGQDYKTWFAQNILDGLISKEEIEPIVMVAREKKTEINWNTAKLIIEKKYGADYANRIILKSKMGWSGEKKRIEEYCQYVIEYLDKYGKTHEFDWTMNQYAWTIFTLSNDKKLLTKALQWSNEAIRLNPYGNWMDTYANILYKLGNKGLAIRWQEVAVKLSPDEQELKSTLQKMKNNQPTWTVKK